MKHRRHKVKREHGIIQNALNWLEDLGRNSEVTDIIPGVIEVSGSPERGIVYKYETTTGCKLLLKSNGSIQEAFVVTKDPQWVRKWVEDRFPSLEQVTLPTKPIKPIKPIKPLGVDDAKNSTLVKAKPRVPPAKHSRKQHRGTKILEGDFDQTAWATLGELDDLCLGDRLERATRQALRALQKDLNKSSSHKTTPTLAVKASTKKKNCKQNKID
ncbi:MAG: DUF2103 domain-containing protein [Desulfitobacteriaceae bacterium]